jgi:acyl-CoA synthetase (AMP-forming)/AMP-acid ligase II
MEGALLCAANHAPLTPITFLDRAALVYPDRPAIVASSSGLTRTWRETRDRCLRLTAALAALGVHRHHVVRFTSARHRNFYSNLILTID